MGDALWLINVVWSGSSPSVIGVAPLENLVGVGGVDYLIAQYVLGGIYQGAYLSEIGWIALGEWFRRALLYGLSYFLR